MILHLEKKYINKYLCKDPINESHYDIFFKNIYLQIYRCRLLINANNKFNTLLKSFILAWSYRINDKAYVNRRRILRSNASSSY